MAIKVQHSDLTGDLCHEPKGADTAAAGTVYIANGTGSGSFQQMPLTGVDFTRGTVADITPTSITASYSIDGTGLAQPLTGVMQDVGLTVGISAAGVATINKNFRELYENVTNVDAQVTDISTALTNLDNTVNSLLLALRNAGVLNV